MLRERVVDIVDRSELARFHPVEATLANVLLGFGRDPCHAIDRFDGVLPDGGFAGKHHRIGAVVDCVGHIARLSPRRSWVLLHRIEHVRRRNHRLACRTRFGNQLLLHRWHALERNFHAQVAACHHNAIECGNDRYHPLDRFGAFHFRQHRATVAETRRNFAQFRSRFRPAHERQRQPIRTRLHCHLDCNSVAIRYRGNAQRRVWEVDSLVRLEFATDDNAGGQPAVTRPDCLKLQAAIVQQHAVPRPDIAENFRLGDDDVIGVNRSVAE